MPTQWQTFPVEMRGGLITNVSPLQQGINFPGSARSLINFEPSIEGGYRRIEGFNKFDESFVPPYGEPLVQGSGQTGTTLVVANIFSSPQGGDTLAIAGVDGTYVISAVSFNTGTKTATLTLTESLDSSPADKALVTFSNRSADLIEGIVFFKQKSVVYRNADLWESSGTGWTRINTPNYGTVLVDGGSQTGTTLSVDGLTSAPQIGDTFTVTGLEKVYTITGAVTLVGGSATLTIDPALTSSPVDNAAVTFLSTDRSVGGKHRFVRYNFFGAPRILGVDGTNPPFKYDGTTFTVLNAAPVDVLGADHVSEFKTHLFFAKGNQLTFTAPYSDDDFNPANGAGAITIPHRITGLIVFREQLLIFSTSKIHRLVGNTIADFNLQPISLDIGCVREDTIQEVGGDIAFLGPDGVRLLSATDRIGDFGLAVASRPIQSEANRVVRSNTSFASCVIRSKNQYRMFGFSGSISQSSATGLLATQFADQTSEGMAWAETRGLLVYVVDSVYSNEAQREVVVFANKDGYVYRMESGNSFDGAPIPAYYSTPFFSTLDPRVRKTFYKLTTYVDPEGSVTGVVTPRLDFDEPDVPQPSAIAFTNTTGPASVYGSSSYGVATYGSKLRYAFTNQLVGSGFTFSLQYAFESTNPPFSLDAITIEFASNDRQ
jgi:hypothetical protein